MTLLLGDMQEFITLSVILVSCAGVMGNIKQTLALKSNKFEILEEFDSC